MKILSVSAFYYPATHWGGPIVCQYGLYRALLKLTDTDIFVLTTDAADPILRLDVPVDVPVTSPYGYPVQFCRRINRTTFSFQLLARLPKRIADADIVHLAEVYWSAVLPTLALCRLMRKPLIWSPHGSLLAAHVWPDVRRKRLKRIWDRVAQALVSKKCSILHVTSEEEGEASSARIRGVPVRVVPNGVDLPDTFPSRNWRPEGVLRLIFMGRITPEKGIENLLDAMPLLPECVTLAIYGTGDAGYVKHLRHACDTAGLSGRVTFGGHVEGARKEEAFCSGDLCIVPSYTESFCIVVAEALGRGVPVVASTGTPWAEVGKRGCGLWVDNSPASLARAIEALAPEDLQAMGRRGRDWIAADFGWAGIAREMRKLCDEAVAMSNA